jgi:hypothetical protein
VQSTFVSFVLYPLRGQGGVLLAVESIGVYLTLLALYGTANYGGVHALLFVCTPIVWVFGLGVFQHYAWATLRHVAAGHTTTLRTIDVEEVSPLTNYLAFLVASLLLGIAGALSWCAALSVPLAVVIGAAVGTVLPAMLGVMILEEHFLAGFNPAAVWRFMTNFGAGYMLFAAALYTGISALYGIFLMPPPDFVVVFGACFVFVLGHLLAGRVAYNFRDRLDLATLPDIDPVAVATDETVESLMLDLHRLCAVDRVELANSRLEGFLREQNYAIDERIHQRLLEFQYKPLLLEHNWHYLDRLVNKGKLPRAWLLLRSSLDIDPLFRPGSAATMLALITAAPAADANYVDTLLTDFERSYPGDERLPDALFAHACWSFTQLGRADVALDLLARIERQFAPWSDNAEFTALLARVRRQAGGSF